MQYLRARYYDAAEGRFTTRDTVWGKIEVPLSQNLYVYVGNNPVNCIDPSGHRAMMLDGSGGDGYSTSSTNGNSWSCPGCRQRVLDKQNGLPYEEWSICESKTSITINDAKSNSVRTYCDPSSVNSILKDGSHVLLIGFDGIQSPAENNGFKAVVDKIAQNIVKHDPRCFVYGNAVYDYGYGMASGVFEVAGKAWGYDDEVNVRAKMIYDIVQNGGYDTIYFVGYSGGGTAATRVAETLNKQYNVSIDSMVTIGTPMITMDSSLSKITTDIASKEDPIANIYLGGDKYVTLLVTVDNSLVPPPETSNDPFKYHTYYWKDSTEYKNSNGSTNLDVMSKIISDILVNGWR